MQILFGVIRILKTFVPIVDISKSGCSGTAEECHIYLNNV